MPMTEELSSRMRAHHQELRAQSGPLAAAGPPLGPWNLRPPPLREFNENWLKLPWILHQTAALARRETICTSGTRQYSAHLDQYTREEFSFSTFISLRIILSSHQKFLSVLEYIIVISTARVWFVWIFLKTAGVRLLLYQKSFYPSAHYSQTVIQLIPLWEASPHSLSTIGKNTTK